MAKRKVSKKRVVKKIVEKKKEIGLIDRLTSGSWIDKLSDGWGKSKSFNKDWRR